MVSYFIPRGRFLIKAGLRQQQQQQQQRGKWNMLGQFRRNLATNNNNNNQTKRVDKLVHQVNQKNTHTFSKKKDLTELQRQKQEAWKKWTGFLLKWTPLGFCMFGAIEWQLHRQKLQKAQLPPTASEFQSKIYCSLPLRIISRCWGWLAACYMPVPLRSYVYGWYSQAFGVNLQEALHDDYKYYNSLADFFTRPLKEGVRIIDEKSPLVSPADGKVLHFGSASNSRIEQVKGVNYSLEDFLGPPNWRRGEQETHPHTHKDYTEALKQHHDDSTTLYQCVIYLAPGDYHRFHSPTNWQPTVRRHFTGELLSVSPKVATWLPGLFCLNERALYMGKWEHGFFAYTAVGATNVGSVQIYMDDMLKTNKWVGLKVGAHANKHEYDELVFSGKDQISLKKGELVGQFNMGSTIVLLFEAPKSFKFTIEAGQKIKMGESLGFIE